MSRLTETRSRLQEEYVRSRGKAKRLANSNKTKATNRQKPKRGKR